MSTLKLVTSNTIYQFMGKLITISITLLATFLITRNYGVGGYGQFSLMLSFPALFFIVADFGLNAIGAREITSNESKARVALGNILALRFVISSVLITVGVVSLFLMPYSSGLKLGIVIGLFTIITKAVLSTLNVVFQVKLRYDLSNIASVLGYSVFLVALIFSNIYKFPVSIFIVCYFIGDLISIFVSAFFVKKLGVNLSSTPDYSLAKAFFYSSLPLGLMFVFSQINFKADSILLSFLHLPSHFPYTNIETVGIYGLPYKVFEVALVVPTYIMNSLYPIMLRRYNESLDNLVDTFRKSFLVLLVLGMVVGTLGVLFSDFIISILGGAAFADSVKVLKVLLGFIVIFYLTQPLAWLIVTLKGEKSLPGIYLIAAVFNVCMNIVFIPKYSFLAASNITWMSELVILVLLAITARRQILRQR